MRRTLLLACCLLAGCKQLFGLDDPTQIAPGDAAPDSGICPAASSTCIGDVLRTCTAADQPAIDTTCAWGCGTSTSPMTPGVHCLKLKPTGGGALPSDLDPSSQLVDLALTGDLILDGDTGQIGTAASPSSIRAPGTGVISGIEFTSRNAIGIFRFAKLTISAQVLLVGGDPIVFAANDEIVVSGQLDARGPCTARTAGPGGYRGGDHSQAGAGPGGGQPTLAQGGGGGGGHGAVGGDGTTGATAGATYGDDVITMLIGGGGGAGAAGGGGLSGVGGGGGGAVQLLSNTRITIGDIGGINAGGCGGTSGSGGNDPGGGGGAGGTIVLEAPKVVISGKLAVNGGAGGAGGAASTAASEAGRLDRVRAVSIGAGEPGGSGGAGATLSGGSAGAGLGGGGGGVGRIRITTRANGFTLGPSRVLSPALGDAGTTFTVGSSVVE
jgi:hypothetical protein